MICRFLGGEDGAMRESYGDLSEDRGGAGDEATGSVATSHLGEDQGWQAAELIGISERQMRRWRKRYEEQCYQGLLDDHRLAMKGVMRSA
jgi:hypothetical protein